MDTPQLVEEARAPGVVASWTAIRRFVAGRPELTAALFSFLIFLTTVQIDINASTTPYSTDIGEIQNALPRWGTIHLTGYPQFTFLGSLFVTLLRFLGIEPALGASLYSALWGAVSVALLVAVMRRLSISAGASILAGLLYALSASMWTYSSVAELHSMTMALSFGVLLAALHYHQTQRPASLYWLALLSSHGFVHQRSVGFMGLGLLLLVLPYWRDILRHWVPVTLLALTGPLTYLYLPLRALMGADWVFGTPGNWYGFWAIVLDTKVERIVALPETVSGWWERMGFLNELLLEDWPMLLLVPGFIGLVALGTRITTRERLALILVALANYGLSLIIWIGRASDALLAVKLPVVAMAAVGLGLLTQSVHSWRPVAGRFMLLLWLGVAGWVYVANRPAVTAVSRAPGARQTIAQAARARTLAGDTTVSLLGLWGNDFWQLAYERRYGDQLRGINVINQTDDMAGVLARGDRLLTLPRTIQRRAPSWWTDQLGWPAYVDAPVPGLVEIRDIPGYAREEPVRRLENGVGVDQVQIGWCDGETLWLRFSWIAPRMPLEDQQVIVELLGRELPAGELTVIDDVIRDHPVMGIYPVSRWLPGERIQDAYELEAPADAEPLAVRLGLRPAGAGDESTAWIRFDAPPDAGVSPVQFCRQ